MAVVLLAASAGAAPAQVGTYAGTVLADNPVAYFRFSETGGTTAANSSTVTSPINGTYTNNVALNQPSFPGLTPAPVIAAGFDGTSTYVALSGMNGPGPNQMNGQSFTLEAWIQTTANSLTGTQAYQGNGLIWADVAGVANDYIFAILNNRLSFFTGNPDTSLNGTTMLNDGNWHHVVATRQVTGTNSVLSIYVDGVSDATPLTLSSTQPLTDNPNVALGGNTLDSRYFTGLMDEVALYNTALTPAQVLSHFRAAPEPFAPLTVTGLVGLAALAVGRIRAARAAQAGPRSTPLESRTSPEWRGSIPPAAACR
jgi:hypothetical protein